jgi:hypothetical protein
LGEISLLGLTFAACRIKKTLFFKKKAAEARHGDGKIGGQTPRKSWPPTRIAFVAWPPKALAFVNLAFFDRLLSGSFGTNRNVPT